MNTKKEVSIKKISQDAEDLFRGGFFCSEVIFLKAKIYFIITSSICYFIYYFYIFSS